MGRFLGFIVLADLLACMAVAWVSIKILAMLFVASLLVLLVAAVFRTAAGIKKAIERSLHE